MRNKIVMSLAAVAAMSATSAMANPVNPWAPAQTTVPITVTVQPMIELFTGVAPVGLSIVDAGENQGSANAVQRTLTHLHNVTATVSAEISADIPDNTQFHILIDPTPGWTSSLNANAAKVISWRREGGVYSAASGGFANQASSAGVGSANKVTAFTAASNAGGAGTSTKQIQYFADSRNVMAAQATNTFNVVWTISTP